jgi:glycosyltransferase involved in cell wall biosynthesis
MLKKKILLIEPYFGGSHKQFLQGLMKYVPADFVLFHLPARKWKMRMQLSAPWFVNEINELPVKDRFFDIVLMSTFLDVATFRALIAQVDGWNVNTRFLTYFHENQFSYPGILPKSTNHQFTAINFTAALASDHLAFNSRFNQQTFLDACRCYTSKASDMQLSEQVDDIEKKSRVLYPGIDFELLDGTAAPDKTSDEPLIIWNHRWEHDKNPEEFFDVLFRLKDDNIAFRLAVLGQDFKRKPAVFHEAKRRLAGTIVQFGYIADKGCYYELLEQGRFVVSTSHHEFFGISIIEAVRAGCYPLLPNRRAYPELFDKRFLYDDGSLYQILAAHLLSNTRLHPDECTALTEKFSWRTMAGAYSKWFADSNDISGTAHG